MTSVFTTDLQLFANFKNSFNSVQDNIPFSTSVLLFAPYRPRPTLQDFGSPISQTFFTYKNLYYRFRVRFRVIHILSCDNSVQFKICSLPLIFDLVVFWASIGQDPCPLRL